MGTLRNRRYGHIAQFQQGWQYVNVGGHFVGRSG